jgi:hypothetical protein
MEDCAVGLAVPTIFMQKTNTKTAATTTQQTTALPFNPLLLYGKQALGEKVVKNMDRTMTLSAHHQ